MVISDRSGLPVAARIASGPRNEQKLVVETIDSRFTKALPRLLIGDKAYDSDPLDAELKKRGITLVAPHHPRRRRKTQDGRPLRRYRRRWHVERLFAWLLRYRRVHTRYEYKAGNFMGFVWLACVRILIRHL
jgi:transposase